MMKFFKRRRPAPTVDIDDPLAIRDLLEYPSLRALVAAPVTDTAGAAADVDDQPVAEPSPIWVGLAAAGPISFELTTYPDLAA